MSTGQNKMKPHVPEKRKSPILERAKAKDYGPGGPHTPGAKKKRKQKQIKDGSAEGHKLTGINQ